MGRTERRVLVLGSIVFLLALTATGAAAAPAASDVAMAPSSTPPSLSPAAFAEREAGARGHWSFRHALELIVLVAACGIVVAFYSAAEAGRGGTRVLTRTHRR